MNGAALQSIATCVRILSLGHTSAGIRGKATAFPPGISTLAALLPPGNRMLTGRQCWGWCRWWRTSQPLYCRGHCAVVAAAHQSSSCLCGQIMLAWYTTQHVSGLFLSLTLWPWVTVRPVTLEKSSPELLKDTKEENKQEFMALTAAVFCPLIYERAPKISESTLLYLL